MANVLKRRVSNSSDTSSDDEAECPLSGAEALAACKEFASKTNTDTGLAMMMLQQNGWNLEQAIQAYQNSSKGTKKKSTKKKETQSTVSNDRERENKDPPRRFKILSWNIDGLDEQQNTLETRTKGVIDVIKREEPDAVFLQEVVPFSYDLLRQHLSNYEAHPGNTEGYFIVILTRRDRFKVQGTEIIPYPNTKMGRNLLIVHAMYQDSIGIDLMTSHHESGTEDAASEARIEQLRLCFERMDDAPSDRLVLFGGDLNVREKELKKLGPLPSSIVDLWIATGQRKECAYTWDMNRNTNLYYPSDNYRPRARFDRLYFRANKSSTEIKFQPVYFELEGLEKLASIKRYCSDHWAIQAYFDL